MSSPTFLTKAYNYITGTAPPTEEDLDATLFGPIAILEIALRVLYPPDSNIKYYIEKYSLFPMDFKAYQYGPINLRKYARRFLNGGERKDFVLLGNKINQFINWYFLDNPDAQMKANISKLMIYTQEGLRLIAELPEYKGDNAGGLLKEYADNIQDALDENYPARLRKIVNTDLGVKSKTLLTKDDLQVIMTTFDRAIRGVKEKQQAQDEIRKEIIRIRDLYIPIKKSANVESTNPLTKRNSLIDESSSSESEETKEPGKSDTKQPEGDSKAGESGKSDSNGPEGSSKAGESGKSEPKGPEGESKIEEQDKQVSAVPVIPVSPENNPDPKAEETKSASIPDPTEPIPVTSPANSDTGNSRRKKTNRGVAK